MPVWFTEFRFFKFKRTVYGTVHKYTSAPTAVYINVVEKDAQSKKVHNINSSATVMLDYCISIVVL